MLFNIEVAAGGARENAVVTCFLEHCGQTKLARKLRTYLDVGALTITHPELIVKQMRDRPAPCI